MYTLLILTSASAPCRTLVFPWHREGARETQIMFVVFAATCCYGFVPADMMMHAAFNQ